MISNRSTHEAICEFLAARYAEDLARARQLGAMMVTVGAPKMGVSPETAERQARIGVQRAELEQTFLDETIRPHLGADGLTGQIADRQLRLLAWAYSDHRDYQDNWQ